MKNIRSKASASLKELLDFETALSNLSTRFVELSSDQIDRTIEEGLEMIAEVLKIERCSVAQLSDDKARLTITHAFAQEGTNPLLGVILSEQQPWFTEQLFHHNAVVVSDSRKLPVEAINEKEHCKRQGIKSMVLIPLVVGKTFLGVVGFADMKTERHWPKNLVQRLKMVGIVFANAIMRKQSETLINELLEFETMLSKISARFVELSADQIDRKIEEDLQLISKVLNIDRCVVAQLDGAKTKLCVTHSYAGAGVKIMPRLILNESQPWLYKQLLQGKTVIMSCLDDLPEEAVNEQVHCRNHGIHSMALIPLVVGNSFLGFVSFAAMRPGREWPLELVQRLKMVGIVFSNAIMRKRSEQKLHKAFTEINELKDRLEAENIYLREEISLQHTHEGFIGRSLSIKDALKRSEQVAETNSTVLIMGETGTGKELLAQIIHKLSPRNRQHMIIVNCAALPSNLIESELFGHEKGAFTGAHSRRIGRFELAHDSTIFLDEIGELSLELQVKLLRVLQLNQFERLGGNETIKSDVRVIAATNRDLMQSVNSGEFRMDLYYRLNVFPILLPPLRNRREDVPDLVRHFVKGFCEKMGKRIETIPQKTMQKLQNHSWPGNIRELKNIIERAMIMTSDKTLRIELPENKNPESLRIKTFNEMQKTYILDVLERTGWRVRGSGGAAEILDLKPTTLEAKMSKFGIKRSNSKGLL